MGLAVPAGQLRAVERIWLLGPFLKTLRKRTREQALLAQLDECIRGLWRDPDSPGLNLEPLATAAGHPILSARITLKFRLILVQLGTREVGLLHFDNHDEAYAWVHHNLSVIPTMLGRIREVPRGEGLPASPPLAITRADEEDPIALRAAGDFTRMLEGGIERYLTYLDDEQRQLAAIPARGTLLIKGGAGTGKTAVAIHRVVALLRQPRLLDPRPVLYLCYNHVLAEAVGQVLDNLFDGIRPEEAEVATLHRWCRTYLKGTGLRTVVGGDADEPEASGRPSSRIDDPACEQAFYRYVWPALSPALREALRDLTPPQVWDEIGRVVKGCALQTCQEYVGFNREGRGFGLKRPAREAIWAAYERLRQVQAERRLLQWADLPCLTLARLRADSGFQPYRAVIVDEGQDFSPAMLYVARHLAGGPEGSLAILADPVQDIYDLGHAWTLRVLKVPGGSVRWLRRNYRSTAEIAALARSIVEPCSDLAEDLGQQQPPERSGPRPELIVAADLAEEVEAVCQRLATDLETQPPQYVAVISPTHDGLAPFRRRLAELNVPVASPAAEAPYLHVGEPTVKLLTAASAKGLDFPVVYLVRVTRQAFGGERLACAPRTRRALYVALTRASHRLVVSTVMGQHHPLLEAFDDARYDVTGSCGRQFANLRGYEA